MSVNVNKFFDFSMEPGRKLEVPKYTNHKTVISIITPAWNPCEYLLQTANCILNQTYPYFEWLIIDDGSTKKESLELFKKIEKMDPRIKVIHKKNSGLSSTRDYGVDHTSKETEYVVFIDDDDLLDKTWIEIAYYSMCSNKDAAWCYSDVVNFQGQQTLWNKIFSSNAMKRENLLVSQAMVKKSAFYEVGGFSLEGNGHYEDWIFWLKLIAKGHFPIHLSYYGFWYRRKQNEGQLVYARSRHKENLKEIAEYANKVTEQVNPIEFPRIIYNWDGIVDKVDSFVEPELVKNGKTNILVIVPWIVYGGADKFNVDFAKLINKDKYNVILVSTQPTEYIWRQKFEAEDILVYDLSTFIDHKYWTAFISYLIRSRHIDIILNTNSVTGYNMLPYIHALYPDIKIMDYIHMEEWYNRNGGYSRDSAAVHSVIDKTLFCNGGSEKIMNEHFGIEKKYLKTVYIGVDSDKFDPAKYDSTKLKEKYDIPEDRFVISFIARIDYQKRPYLLMRIIEELYKTDEIPNALFVIGGDGPLLPSIKAIAKEKGLEDYIKFLGVVKKPDEVYSFSDITLNCSIKEGLALTSYESLSMGVPIVSCDVGGQKELINDKTGVIVPRLQKETDIHNYDYSDEEVDNYVKGIIKLYKNINKYKSACRKRILNGFTIQNMIANMEKEFDTLMSMDKKYMSNEKEHIDIYKELLNNHFLVIRNDYTWLCSEYYRKVYGVRIDSPKVHKDHPRLRLIKEKLWEIPIWRAFVRTPIWKFGKKIFRR